MAVGDNWNVGPADWSQAYRDTFHRWGAQDNMTLALPKLSKDILERMKPEWRFRKYINSVADYSRGAGDFILFNRFRNVYTERMKELGEFDDITNYRLGWTRYGIGVKELGAAFAITERLTIFSPVNVENIARNYLQNVITASIDERILFESLCWSDITFVKVKNASETKIHKIYGEAVGDPNRRKQGNASKIFSVPTTSATGTGQFDVGSSVEVDMVDFSALMSTVDAAEPEIFDILEIKAEYIRRRMKGVITPVIINTTLFTKLFNDPFFRQVIAFSRPERIEKGELGNLFGFEFIVDNTGLLDDILTAINNHPTPAANDTPLTQNKKFGSIALFITVDGHREAVALPESIRTDVPVSFGRFNRIGALTYRGEAPIWFYSDNNAYVDPNSPDPNNPQYTPDYLRVSGGIIYVAK